VLLSSKDMIGIVFTGSEKTLVFVLPMIMVALQEEVSMPIIVGEGAFGLVICSSCKLERQYSSLWRSWSMCFTSGGIQNCSQCSASMALI
jgi:superfamily II DNA/RNA helicase